MVARPGSRERTTCRRSCYRSQPSQPLGISARGSSRVTIVQSARNAFLRIRPQRRLCTNFLIIQNFLIKFIGI